MLSMKQVNWNGWGAESISYACMRVVFTKNREQDWEETGLESKLTFIRRPSWFRIKIIFRSQYLSIILTSSYRDDLLCLCYRPALLNKKTYSCSLAYMLWFSFILGSNFLFFCFDMVMHNNNMIMSLKQKKRKFEPRMKLNHNIYHVRYVSRQNCAINNKPSLADVTSAIQVSEQQNKPFTRRIDILLLWRRKNVLGSLNFTC